MEQRSLPSRELQGRHRQKLSAWLPHTTRKLKREARNRLKEQIWCVRIGDSDAPLKELERETQADLKRAWNTLGEYARSQTITVGARPRRGSRAVYRTS